MEPTYKQFKKVEVEGVAEPNCVIMHPDDFRLCFPSLLHIIERNYYRTVDYLKRVKAHRRQRKNRR